MNPLAQYAGIAKNVAILALVAGLIAGYFAWHHHVFAQGEASMKAKWDVEKLKREQAEKAAILKRTKENEIEAEKNRENSRLIQKAHDDQIARLRTLIDNAPRLRVPAFCGGSSSQAQANSPSSSNGADTGAGLLPEALDRDIKALILETEKAAAAGRAAQQFIRDNGLAP